MRLYHAIPERTQFPYVEKGWDRRNTISIKATSPGDRAYELLVQHVADFAIYLMDRQGFITTWNLGAEKIKGYAAEEIIGAHFSKFYLPEDVEKGLPQRALATAFSEGRFEAEAWRVRRDGSRFRAMVVIDAVYDDDGRFVGFAKITRDITERHRSQEALLRSERQFRLLVEGVTDYAIYMLDPERRHRQLECRGERIKGYHRPTKSSAGTSACSSPQEDRAAGVPAACLTSPRAKDGTRVEGWRVRKDGTRFWASVVLDAITRRPTAS